MDSESLFETVSQQIHDRRTQRNMSVKQLADAMGVSAQIVRQWEKGRYIPSVWSLWLLADALECSMDELCGRASDG